MAAIPRDIERLLDRARRLDWTDMDWAEAMAALDAELSRREDQIRDLSAALLDCRRDNRKLLDRVKGAESTWEDVDRRIDPRQDWWIRIWGGRYQGYDKESGQTTYWHDDREGVICELIERKMGGPVRVADRPEGV